MKGYAYTDGNALVWQYDDERVRIEPYGIDSLRVRVTRGSSFSNNDWALLTPPSTEGTVEITAEHASLANGRLVAIVDQHGHLEFRDQSGELVLRERWLNRDDKNNRVSLMYPGRELRPILGGKYRATLTLEAYGGERIYGGGQRQIPYLDLKGCDLELSQRNSQASVPFVVSNRGYGFFWNNPAHGRVTFAKNHTQWSATVTDVIDYWITLGSSPAEILEKWTAVAGRAPVLPAWATGFWQSKLRYRSQDELLSVAREYARRQIPLSVIVADFFHWTEQGDWKFDPRLWPDPNGMVEELRDLGIELMVSIWPTVDPHSENYAEMKAKGLLVHADRGVPTQHVMKGHTVYYDATNPEARAYVWDKVRENYRSHGIQMFWLDEAEPEYTVQDFDIYRYYEGTNLEVGNIYPLRYAQGFYEGLRSDGVEEVVNLVRCAWAGSQRYGVVLWSGDIHSNFETLRIQLRAGLNAGISGIPWWTTDIGGFFGGDPESPSFRELLVRWFQYGVFCPIFRIHGFREPTGFSNTSRETGDNDVDTCGPNELWSFGEEVYEILRGYLFIRERLRPYIDEQAAAAAQSGAPIIRPLFWEFSKDPLAWDIEDQFMFGPDILVAPVLEEGARRRSVYLPAGTTWTDVWSGSIYDGGCTVDSEAPLTTIPVFARNGAERWFTE